MSYYTRSELRRLRDAAAEYVYSSSGDKQPCNWLYRNKDDQYFADIEASGGVMCTVLKDHGGDPKCPINGRLSGLFFLANNEYGEPPQYSYFGPRRIQIEADELFRLSPNLYFADFYCMSGVRHYVILVMTETRSSADLFCQRHLVRLDKTDNPFLYFNNGQLYTSDADDFDVEIFYTENVNITELQSRGKAAMKTVETKGQGHSTRGGKKKSLFCSTCNLSGKVLKYTVGFWR